ncbi:MAG: hypothetical protein ABIH36_02750 [bacterium]
MQARIKKLNEDRYALMNETDGGQATVPMTKKQVRALVLEALYGPKVDLLLKQADEEFIRQQELDLVVAGDSGEMAPPSLPTVSDDNLGPGEEDFVEED